MKPRTKIEKEVARLSALLPSITPTQEKALKRNANPSTAYHTKHQQWCVSCGGVMKTGEKTCPHCGRKFENIKSARFTTEERKDYATIHTTFKGYQVARHFVVWRKSRKGQETRFQVNEAVQEWINDKGQRAVMAHPVNMHSWYYDLWVFSVPMSIKRDPVVYSRGWGKYEIYSQYNRWESLLPVLKRNGAKRRDIGISPVKLYKSLLSDNITEELLKTGQIPLLARHLRGYRNEIPMHAVRICNRNHYIVQNADEWCDYIQACEQLGLDTHNAHYVCPTDLTQAHDRANNRLQSIDKRELNKRTAKMYEELYKKLHAKYLAIFFGNDEIEIKVAQSVEDIRQEGEAMKHCVFANGYYKKAETLILFARNRKDGSRIETIEIDTKSYRVVQSRGVCNKLTPQHNEIVNLCNQNMHLFRAVA